MPSESVEVSVKAVLPTPEGSGVFLGTDKKTFVIYVDPTLGHSIALAITPFKKERPLTHDLMGNILNGLGASLERMVINDVQGTTFYARLILKMENEIGVKLVEVDARPSDAIVLALNARKPIAVAKTVLEKVEDVTAKLSRMLKERN